MKKSVIIGIIIIIILLIVVIGVISYSYMNNTCSAIDDSKCNKKCNIDNDCKKVGCSCVNKFDIIKDNKGSCNTLVAFGCKCMNNQCSSESIIPHNNQSDCLKEGKSGSSKSPEVRVCCSGLNEIKLDFENNGTCQKIMDGFICTKCGDGVCGTGENKCNCPQDCGQDLSCIKSQDCKIDSYSCKCININESLTTLPPNAGITAPCNITNCNCKNNKCEGFIGLVKDGI